MCFASPEIINMKIFDPKIMFVIIKIVRNSVKFEKQQIRRNHTFLFFKLIDINNIICSLYNIHIFFHLRCALFIFKISGQNFFLLNFNINIIEYTICHCFCISFETNTIEEIIISICMSSRQANQICTHHSVECKVSISKHG